MSEQEVEVARKMQINAYRIAPVLFVWFVLRSIVAAPVLLFKFALCKVTPEEFGARVSGSGWAMWNLGWGSLEALLLLPLFALGWLNRQVGPYSGVFAAGVLIGGVVAGVYVSFMNPNAAILLIVNIVWVTALVFFGWVFLYAIYAQNKIAEEDEDGY